MGKAQITADLGDGLYRIDYYRHVDVSEEIARINGIIAALQAKIDGGDPNSSVYELRIKDYQKQIDFLQAYADADPEDRQAWLADHPDDAPAAPKVGDMVGIVEIDREDNGENLNIYPAFAGAHIYSETRDGIMMPVPLMNPFCQYYNLAIAPALQKWKPRYRHAVVNAVDYDDDTATVDILAAYAQAGISGEDPININQDNEVLSDVPVEYMDCNAAPFEVGDEVLVKFDNFDWNQPKVIGFMTNPKSCDENELVYVRFGELGIVWDTKTNAYHEDLPGTQTVAACEAFLAEKIETTITDDGKGEAYNYRGLPYTRLLRCFYTDAAYEIYHSKTTTWGLTEHEEAPGYLWDDPWLSDDQEIIEGEETTESIRTIEHGDTVCPWGTLYAAWTETDTTLYNNFPWYQISTYGNDIEKFSSWEYLESAFICPLDAPDMPEALEYYGYGTDAEFGNDPIGVWYPGCAMSEKTFAQVIFSSHVFYDYERPVGGVYVKTYTTTRETVAHCTAGPFPWDETLETDPQAQPRNDDLSTAVALLIEDFYTLIGYGETDIIGYVGLPLLKIKGPCDTGFAKTQRISDDGVFSYQSPGGPACSAGCNRTWKQILTPEFFVKIYRR